MQVLVVDWQSFLICGPIRLGVVLGQFELLIVSMKISLYLAICFNAVL